MQKITIKKFFLLAILLISTTFIYAVPANPTPVAFSQPNGDELTVMIRGDERIHWYESMDGYTLLFNKEGFLTYAYLDASGNLQASEIVATDVEDRDIVVNSFLNTIEKELFYSDVQIQVMQKVWEIEDEVGFRGEQALAGHYKTLCAFVQFQEKAMVKEMAQFEGLFNQLGYTANGKGSVRDYFRESSYGKFDLTITLCGVYTAPKSEEYYAGEGGTDNCPELARWLAQQVAAEPDINFADYDSDNDGKVDGFHFIFSGKGQEAGGGKKTIWSHKWQFSPKVTKNGKSISVYSCSPELLYNQITTIGVVCHEMTHAFGAPDFYDTNYGTGGQYNGTGNWDLMAGGSWNGSPGGNCPPHHNMYTKIQFEWVTPIVLNSPITVEAMLNSAENPMAFRVNASTNNERYLLENRRKIKFDNSVPGEGLIIYHVHNSTMGMNTTHPQRMYPVCASSTTAIPTSTPSSYGSINSAGCPFPGTSEKNEFNGESTPTMFKWNSNDTGTPVDDKPITDIVSDVSSKTVSFDFMGGGPINYLIIAVASQGGSISSPGAFLAPEGSNKSFTFSANSGYFIEKVLIDGTNDPQAVQNGNYTFSNISESHTIHVVFASNTYTIKAKAGTGGTITPQGTATVNYGDSKTYSFQADYGYIIDKVWIYGINNPQAVTEGSYTFENVTTDQVIEVTFTPKTYTVTFPEAEGATFTPHGTSSSPVIHGGRFDFTVSLDEEFKPYSNIVIKANGDIITPLGGVYSIKSIVEDQIVTISGLTNNGIEDNEWSKVLVFPNPTTGELRIENGELRINNVEIYDILGKKQGITVNYQLSIINCSHLSAGIYFLKIDTEEGTTMRKIVKE